MGVSRRKFVATTGLAALGIASGKSTELLASNTKPGHHTPQKASHGKVKRNTKGVTWAMVVDIRKCLREKGCTKCIDACHLDHNVPDIDSPEDEVKWIWKESFEHSFHENKHDYLDEEIKHAPVMLLCNHCDNPGCVKVCPTKATWKREKDGLVMMDWHRCIGCRYCIAACPYGSRSFNYRDPRASIRKINDEYPTRTIGVVEKCTFCEERLAEGKMPLCVEACDAGALYFGNLEDPSSEVRQILKTRFTIRRKPALGTEPQIYYIV